MKVLVTGGTGFIGSHLVDRLLERGDEVRCTVRPSSSLRWLEGKPLQLLQTDFADPSAMDTALEGIDQVYHVAGAITARTGEQFVAVNGGLATAVAEACARRPSPPRLLYVSSLAAAGPSPVGRSMSEADDPRPISFYGKSKLGGEHIIQMLGDRVGWTIVRPPVVYGPRDQGLLTAFKLVRWRLRPRIGTARDLSVIHVRDLVQGLAGAMEHPDALGKVFYMSHPDPVTMKAIAELIARALGRRTLAFPVPDRLLKAGAVMAELPSLVTKRNPPFNRDKAREMTQTGWVCDSSRAREELGFEANTGHAEGLAETARWYRQQGWL